MIPGIFDTILHGFVYRVALLSQPLWLSVSISLSWALLHICNFVFDDRSAGVVVMVDTVQLWSFTADNSSFSM